MPRYSVTLLGGRVETDFTISNSTECTDFNFSFTTQAAPCAPLWGIECRIAGPLNALPFSPGMLCAGNSVGQEILTCTSVFTVHDL